jgi:SAM-dependent methyltransferase
MSPETFWSHFYAIYETLPRQGPGDRESTERALGLLPPLTSHHRILDAGCGSGTQTIDLARATAAQIVAVDSHEAFVTQLVKRAADQGLGARIQAQVGDMNELTFPDGSFDVIWCEGAKGFVQAADILGAFDVAEGLAEWPLAVADERLGERALQDLCGGPHFLDQGLKYDEDFGGDGIGGPTWHEEADASTAERSKPRWR